MDEIKIDIFSTIFISEDLDFPLKLVLNQGSKNLEEVKTLRLMLQEVKPAVPGKFIYEG